MVECLPRVLTRSANCARVLDSRVGTPLRTAPGRLRTAGSAIARRLLGGYNRAAMGDRDEARRMLDYLPVLSWRGLPDGSKDFFNPLWHEFTGLSPEPAPGSGGHTTIPPDDVAAR